MFQTSKHLPLNLPTKGAPLSDSFAGNLNLDEMTILLYFGKPYSRIPFLTIAFSNSYLKIPSTEICCCFVLVRFCFDEVSLVDTQYLASGFILGQDGDLDLVIYVHSSVYVITFCEVWSILFSLYQLIFISIIILKIYFLSVISH